MKKVRGNNCRRRGHFEEAGWGRGRQWKKVGWGGNWRMKINMRNTRCLGAEKGKRSRKNVEQVHGRGTKEK